MGSITTTHTTLISHSSHFNNSFCNRLNPRLNSQTTTTLSFSTRTQTKNAHRIVSAFGNYMNDKDLSEADLAVHSIIEKEKERQFKSLNLIASENYTSRAVMQAEGSCLTNKYSEGLPGERYYTGNVHIDEVETLGQERGLAAFHLDPEKWEVNVQPHSGSIANSSIYYALAGPQGKIMGLALSDGGHLSHGHTVSVTSKHYVSEPYHVDQSTGLIDYEDMEKRAMAFRPNILIAGASAYPREFDYLRMRKIADAVGAFLMMDMAHISGLVAASVLSNPFDYCDVVTTTTHKSLRGPRHGMIFFKKDIISRVNLECAISINRAVFPATQGGPHNNNIGAVAVCLEAAQTPAFKAYAGQVLSNCKALATRMIELGYKLSSGGSDNHLILADLRPLDIDGRRVEKILEMASITVNGNTVPGNTNAKVPRGIRIGTPAMTTRGFTEKDFIATTDFVHEGIQIAIEAKKSYNVSNIVDFEKHIKSPEFSLHDRVADLRSRVQDLTTQFPLPGV